MFNLRIDDDLSALSDVVNSFKSSQNAWISWRAHIRPESISINFDIDDISLSQCKRLYKTMKDLGKLVERLLDDIAEESQVLEMKLMPVVRKRGINSLPDEILRMILAQNVRSTYYWRSQDLQLTCKRFNAIVNSSADCWSRVTNSRSLSKKEISQISMRKTLPIDIYIENCTKLEDPFINILLCNPDRITSIEWERNDYCHKEFLPDYAEMCINLSALKSLRLGDFRGFPKWNLPNLTHLYAASIPSPGSFPLLQHWSFRHGVGTRNCDYYEITSREGLAGDEILKFLNSTPRLRSLALCIDYKGFLDVSETSSATLAGVEWLTINYYCSSESANGNKFMERLKLPQVKRIIFIDDMHDGLYAIFGEKMTLPTVKSLEYQNKYECRIWERHDYLTFLKSYDELYRVFPNLERLDIRTEGYLFWYNPNATCWPNLHTVSLWHDHNHWKANVAGLMANKNFASRLKHLRICGTPRKDRFSDRRVDESIRKILASVYDEDVLEIQPGIKAKELDYDSLLRFRSEVGAKRIASQ